MSALNIDGITGEQLAKLVIDLRQLNPTSFDAIVASLQKPQTPAASVTLPKLGDLVADRGVYLGEWAGVHAYAGEEFLRDKKGKQLLLTFNEATKEFAARNGGRRYGTGTEADIRQAITTGTYQDGDLVLPAKELLHGRDVHGNTTRLEANIYSLMKKAALPKVAAAVQNGEGDQRWALSGSERPDNASLVYHVRLTDGGRDWLYKDNGRSGAVPVRLYRQPHATGPAPQII